MKVYISSTYQDLIEHRKAVQGVLGSMRYEVVGMEHYVASDERPVDRCLEDVERCDVYIGIIAFRYGFVPPGYDRSITELEYQAATEAERLLFLTYEDAEWPRNQVEMGAGAEQLQRFRKDISEAHMVGFFRTPDELGKKVATALQQLAQRRLEDEVREVRAGQAEADRNRGRDRWRQRVVNNPPVDVSWFCGRTREQAELRQFLGDERVRMVSVVGRPGVGKSALATRVVVEVQQALESEQAEPPPVPAEGILYLSSHSTGLGLERLYTDARRMLDSDAADALAEYWSRKDATVPQKVDALFQSLREWRFLVLLDGLETVLGDDGAITEEGLRAFVERSLWQGVGLCLVVTSRADPLVPPQGLLAARVIRLQHGLDVDDAVSLLRALDPQNDRGLRDAPDEDLRRAAELSGGIPRSLQALAAILDAQQDLSLQRLLADERGLLTQTVETLIAEGFRRLGDNEQRVMHALAVLDKPVTHTPISYIVHTWCPGIDVSASLGRLVRSYFVTASRSTGEYSLQPLDRAHAYYQIPETAEHLGPLSGETVPCYCRETLELRAAEYYASVRKPETEWKSIDDLEPQLSEFRHRVQGGDVDTALEVLDSVDAEHLFLWGHYTRIIELRRSVLDRAARASLRAANLGSLATCCQVIGAYDDAIDYYERAVEAARETGEVGAEARYVGNLGRLYRNMGYMDKAVSCSVAALNDAKDRGDREAQGTWSDRLGLAYGSLGMLREAAELHEHALAVAREFGDRGSEGAALSNLGLLDQFEGETARAETRYLDALAIAREVGDRRGVCILLGRLGTIAFAGADYESARAFHEEALALASELGERREQSYQLLGIGRACLARGDFAGAVDHLRAARDLEMSETSYWAALNVGLALLRASDESAAEAFGDAVGRAEERLGRCDRLWGARYALATAMVGRAACATEAKVIPSALLEPALDEYRRAIENCSGAGAVRSALEDLSCLRAAGVTGVGPVVDLLEGVRLGAVNR